MDVAETVDTEFSPFGCSESRIFFGKYAFEEVPVEFVECSMRIPVSELRDIGIRYYDVYSTVGWIDDSSDDEYNPF